MPMFPEKNMVQVNSFPLQTLDALKAGDSVSNLALKELICDQGWHTVPIFQLEPPMRANFLACQRIEHAKCDANGSMRNSS